MDLTLSRLPILHTIAGWGWRGPFNPLNLRFAQPVEGNNGPRSIDGLVVTATTNKLNDRIHARFAFSYDADYAKQHQPTDEKDKEAPKMQDTSKPAEPAKDKEKSEPKPSVEQEVASLNEKTKDWVYILPSYKADLLQRKQDELIASLREDKPRTSEPPKDPWDVERPGKK
jgi:hypothetical protein